MELNVQKITTKNENGINGWMMPFCKTSDPFWDKYEVKYIYATSINPSCKKGPILHLKRECRLFPVQGKSTLIVRMDDTYHKYELDAEKPKVICIKVGDPFCLYNDGNKECILINIANHCWSENDQDSHVVCDWSEEGRYGN